ncbi:MAG: hypothetical protein C4541_02135 [Candidatus Auribacter fodinae]|jgi:hypothetical protein|uniref:Uncharacterized protein n=1 Tax=Candidatus Auribacter fodinae TaxID=2093366 RepID=A0A3A4RFR9_9BACT|nr:MAG: hypothetical protein C4541_02135 [Candidatus Auribacter fodinae]
MAESVEKQVQDFVVGIDNIGARAIRVVAWLLASVVLFFITFSLMTSYPIRLAHPDAIDYAQIAKNVSRGQGVTTNFIRPVSLRYFPSFEKHPELTNPPLYSLYLGMILKMFNAPSIMKGEIDRKIIFYGSGIFFILSVPLMLILANMIVPKNIAHLSVLFYITNTLVLAESITALPTVFLTVLFLIMLIPLASYDGDNLLKPVMVGFFLGLCYLTRYSFGLFAIPLFIFFFFRARKFKFLHAMMFLLAFLAVISPWLVRNYRLTGNPFFTLEFLKYKMFTEPFPGNLAWRSSLDSIADKNFNFFFFLRKITMGVKEHYSAILSLMGTFLTPFVIVAYFMSGTKSRFDKIKWIILLLFAIQLCLSALFRPGANGILPFFPIFTIIGVSLFIDLLDLKRVNPFIRLGLVTIFIVLNITPVLFGWMPKLFDETMHRKPRLYWEDNIQNIAVGVLPGSVILSDIPWATAWYGDLKSVWLPWGVEDYEDINKRARDIDGAYFSPSVLRYPQSEDKIWIKLYSYLYRYNKVPENNRFGWTWSTVFKNGDVFLSKSAILKQE